MSTDKLLYITSEPKKCPKPTCFNVDSKNLNLFPSIMKMYANQINDRKVAYKNE